MKTAAKIFNENSMNQFSVRILKKLTERNPDDFFAWQLLYRISATPSERVLALSRMRELDPLNPEIASLAP